MSEQYDSIELPKWSFAHVGPWHDGKTFAIDPSGRVFLLDGARTVEIPDHAPTDDPA